MINQESILSLLAQFPVDYLNKDLVSAGCVKSVIVDDQCVYLELVLYFPAKEVSLVLKNKLNEFLRLHCPTHQFNIEISWKVATHVIRTHTKGMTQIKNTIAVASGKGGVGKSTTAVNLALALQKEGAKVGILDADIYGPSQPQMLGSYQPPEAHNNRLQPVVLHGLQTMSMGYLIAEEKAVIWRGPMVSGALQQLLNDTDWQDLDYLIIDLPPGTGDIQLTLCQKIPLTAAIVVTTPQDLALVDVRRAIAMFNKVSVPVLGIIENMSVHVCQQCGHQEYLFGQGGGQRIAAQYNIDLLGEIPLASKIQEQADGGKPTVAAEPDSELSKVYENIALKVAGRLSLQAKEVGKRFPKIVVENN